MRNVHPLPGGGRRRPTATSSFGVSRRESHDASAFYARFHAPQLSSADAIVAHRARDRIWVGDARWMDDCGEIADDSVALVVTSPPYFAGKEYEAALGEGHVPATYQQYLEMLHDVFAQCRAKLEPGGRVAVNVANLGRKPYRSLAADVIAVLDDLGFLLRGEIVWRKQAGASGSCAWGTYQHPANPVLRDVTERVVVASKGRFDRAPSAAERRRRGWPHEASITVDEFVDATLDLWEIPAEQATRVGHPAPFPVELPRRLIELYTYRGDLVLDPFMGSGSTAVAAVRAGRHYVGFDTDPGYAAQAERRIAEERARLAGKPRRPPVVAPRSRVPAAADADPFALAGEGHTAKTVARAVLEVAGFAGVEQDVVFRDLGVGVAFRARDEHGRTWLFDVAGAFSSTRPGVRREETLWRTLGRACVLREARRRDGARRDLGLLVVLSTDLPAPGTSADRALRAVTGDDAPLHAVVELLGPDTVAQLRACAGAVTPAR